MGVKLGYSAGMCRLLLLSLALPSFVACGDAVDAGSSDAEDRVEYAAAAAPGGLDHIFIMKANYTKNTCSRIHIAAPTTGSYSINTPKPWGVRGITPTNDTTDCLDWTMPQQGQAAVPLFATGAITWTVGIGRPYPCELNIEALVTIEEPPPPNLQSSEAMSALNVAVADACI